DMVESNLNFKFIELEKNKKKLKKILDENQDFISNLSFRIENLKQMAIIVENICKDIEKIQYELLKEASNLNALRTQELEDLKVELENSADGSSRKIFAIARFKNSIKKIEENNPLA